MADRDKKSAERAQARKEQAEKAKAKLAEQAKKPQTHTFLVDGNVLQRTVELLAALQLTHPASVQRDQLCAYYTGLKSIESIGKSNDDSG